MQWGYNGFEFPQAVLDSNLPFSRAAHLDFDFIVRRRMRTIVSRLTTYPIISSRVPISPLSKVSAVEPMRFKQILLASLLPDATSTTKHSRIISHTNISAKLLRRASHHNLKSCWCWWLTEALIDLRVCKITSMVHTEESGISQSDWKQCSSPSKVHSP